MAAYTRTTCRRALVQRQVHFPTVGRITVVQAVPVSKVLVPLPCDLCHNEIPRGELVLREKRGEWWRTTCGRCADIILVETLH